MYEWLSYEDIRFSGTGLEIRNSISRLLWGIVHYAAAPLTLDYIFWGERNISLNSSCKFKHFQIQQQ